MSPRARRASLSPVIRKGVVGLTLTLVLLVGCFVAVGYSPFLNIEKIEVHGLHHLTLAEIEQRLGFEPGDPLLSLDHSAVRRRIEALPRVQSVSVDRSWSGVVLIEIIEHQPAALVMSEPEQWALIASDGRVLTHGLTSPPDLPRISGIRAAGTPGSHENECSENSSGFTLPPACAAVVDPRAATVIVVASRATNSRTFTRILIPTSKTSRLAALTLA